MKETTEFSFCRFKRVGLHEILPTSHCSPLFFCSGVNSLHFGTHSPFLTLQSARRLGVLDSVDTSSSLGLSKIESRNSDMCFLFIVFYRFMALEVCIISPAVLYRKDHTHHCCMLHFQLDLNLQVLH